MGEFVIPEPDSYVSVHMPEFVHKKETGIHVAKNRENVPAQVTDQTIEQEVTRPLIGGVQIRLSRTTS